MIKKVIPRSGDCTIIRIATDSFIGVRGIGPLTNPGFTLSEGGRFPPNPNPTQRPKPLEKNTKLRKQKKYMRI